MEPQIFICLRLKTTTGNMSDLLQGENANGRKELTPDQMRNLKLIKLGAKRNPVETSKECLDFILSRPIAGSSKGKFIVPDQLAATPLLDISHLLGLDQFSGLLIKKKNKKKKKKLCAFCLDVRTLTFCQLMGFLLNH